MPSVYIETFGCQMNDADSRYIAERATSAGYEVASAPEEASVLVLNTCTVRDNAERRAYGRMNHFKALKTSDPSVRLVVTGCLAEQDRDRMQQRAPHVDAVFGTRELAALGDQLAAWALDEVAQDAPRTDDAKDNILRFALGGTPDGVIDAFSHLRAFVTVQRGCSYYCTFCIVPYVRGRFDHRPRHVILAEAREHIARGAREIMLVGQTVNAWRDPAGGADFGDLCRSAAQLPGLERLTFISPHPKDFTTKILDDLASLPQLNPRIHLPLQSASDAVLRRMNRKYTIAQFDRVVEAIRARIPGAAITTDLIVGFPGESEDDFEATLAYVESGLFANAFTFIYSIRRGTPAARWEQVPPEVAAVRFARLLDAQNRVTRRYHDAMVGRVVRALLAGDSKKDPTRLAAKTLDNVTVVAPKPAEYPDAERPWLDIAIESAHVWGCMGRVVARAARFSQSGTPLARPVIDLI
ncbi:MAG TPA: tRNA (N6-isopentenyl adenosine(37)-C2)-methylthiotransferase MiaB [Candidatus Cybelea sp.]|jgi:tRNA-2-methylthio-N6-dimethylallyladenosine synthase|nr:tRNA (N6-isopentenyl adenosine(37)-C2)-methylthiotransferase MiaB [Candidatus Cybelea sp.]